VIFADTSLVISIPSSRMSYDLIHDWLDMVFRTLGGEKGVYREYKENQDRERRQREQ
jgi:hypothetical protein